MQTGIERIAAERRRQVEDEGFTADHDDNHVRGELAGAASAYAMAASAMLAIQSPFAVIASPPPFFLFEPEMWKPSDDPVRDLERAGALIAAEIDRILRDRAVVFE